MLNKLAEWLDRARGLFEPASEMSRTNPSEVVTALRRAEFRAFRRSYMAGLLATLLQKNCLPGSQYRAILETQAVLISPANNPPKLQNHPSYRNMPVLRTQRGNATPSSYYSIHSTPIIEPSDTV